MPAVRRAQPPAVPAAGIQAAPARGAVPVSGIAAVAVHALPLAAVKAPEAQRLRPRLDHSYGAQEALCGLPQLLLQVCSVLLPAG